MPDILNALSTIPGTAVLIGLLTAAAALVVLINWRLSIVALGAQYILIGLMLTRVVPLELAAVKALVGVMICPVLYLTARRVHWGQRQLQDEQESGESAPRRQQWLINPGLPLRAIVAVLALALSVSLAERNPLPILSDQTLTRALTIGTFSVILLGLLNAALAESPLKVGLGLLSILAGFELFYTAVEPTLTLVGVLGLTNLMLALAIAYLTTASVTRDSEAHK